MVAGRGYSCPTLLWICWISGFSNIFLNFGLDISVLISPEPTASMIPASCRSSWTSGSFCRENIICIICWSDVIDSSSVFRSLAIEVLLGCAVFPVALSEGFTRITRICDSLISPCKLTISHLLDGKKPVRNAFQQRSAQNDQSGHTLSIIDKSTFVVILTAITLTGPHYYWTIHERKKEDCMLEVTESATQQITEQLKGKEVSAIRIFLNEGGWGGPSLALALDEPNDKDEAYDISGYKYVVDKELLEQAKPIKIDFMGMNFNITSSMVFEGGCGSCGSSSSGCSWEV